MFRLRLGLQFQLHLTLVGPDSEKTRSGSALLSGKRGGCPEPHAFPLQFEITLPFCKITVIVQSTTVDIARRCACPDVRHKPLLRRKDVRVSR